MKKFTEACKTQTIRSKSGFMSGILRRVNTVYDPNAITTVVSALPASIRQKLQGMYDTNTIKPGDLEAKVPPPSLSLALSPACPLSACPLPATSCTSL